MPPTISIDGLNSAASICGLHGRLPSEGSLVLAGLMGDPPESALLLFAGDSPAAAEAFARADPYVANALVVSWRVRPWITVVGEDAATPVRA